MVVKEFVKLKDGRNITLNMTEEECMYLMSYAVNMLIAQGALAIGNTDGGEIVGEAEAVKPETLN